MLSAAAVEALLESIDTTDPIGLRDRAIIEAAYSTAMRRSELAGLALSDVLAQQGLVLIRLGKGKKDRMVPIGRRALEWLERYLVQVRPGLVVPADDGALFRTWLKDPISPGALGDAVAERMRAAGIEHGGCHALRHTAATLMLRGGAGVRFIQELLGHSDLGTTQRYTRVSIRDLKEVHQRTHPAG